jgi:hypothetical protein
MNAENGSIYLEQGAVLVPYVALTDSGDHKTYTPADDIFSGKSGRAPVIRPNGMVTGRNVLSVHADADKVTVAAFTAYAIGVLQSVAAGTATIVRATTPETHMINSITMTSAGAVAVVTGTEGTAFSETRAAAGGPPLIPVDSVEIGQVRTTAFASAVIAAGEIFQIVGQHAERYDYPVWGVNNLGEGNAADVAAKTNSFVELASAQPLAHTGPITKKVYAQYYTPTFAEISKALDFTPCELSHSVASKQYMRGTIGSTSSSLGQGGFTALLEDGVMDALVADKNEVLTVKFFPDKDTAPYILSQGTIGLKRTFPVGDQIQAAVTISAENESAEFAG